MRTFQTIALAVALPGVLAAAAPASAAPGYPWDSRVEQTRSDRWDHDRGYRYTDRYGRRYYEEPLDRNSRVWRDRDGRYHCRKRDGSTGLVIGGAAGALIGHEVAGRGDRTLGAILGAVGGGLLGRSVDRGNSRCR